MTWCCVIERWVQQKTDQNLIFNGNCTQIVFFCFRIHFDYVLSYLFGLFGVRTCVSILWHTSLPKNATFAWKNSEKPWFWQFLVIFVFLTCHLWRHCGVTQGMFVFFWYQWTREGHSYPLVPHTWCFVNRFRDLTGAESTPRLWDGSKKPGSFRVKLGDVQCTMSLIQIMLILYHFTSPYDESERSLYHLVDRNMNSVIRKVMEA